MNFEMSSEYKEDADPSLIEMENLLPEGEHVPSSWESGGYELSKRKIQDLNKTIRALKRGRTYKSYQERMKEGGKTDSLLDENLSGNADKVVQRDSLLGVFESLQKDFHIIECEGNKSGKVSDSEDSRTRQNSGESSIKSWDEMLNMKSNENYSIPTKKDGITTNMPLWQILATEYIDDIKKNMDRFRVLNFFLNQRHISFEHFCKKVKVAFPEVRIQIRHDKDIEKVSWLYELDDLCQSYKDADPTLHFPELKRLQRFFKFELQEIPFIKATLKILFLPEGLLKEWLSIRHLPMLVTD
ncbi:Hypothetical predicted protein [Octopus vulgaris]|uniref:Uncharacterized protein n=1 Tax=Octopus vulgaris TaxID=6645 RepID=A0AA36AV61_OCTVU|nr:Hypothetical predicted protein [Octopus vulgaris]